MVFTWWRRILDEGALLLLYGAGCLTDETGNLGFRLRPHRHPLVGDLLLEDLAPPHLRADHPFVPADDTLEFGDRHRACSLDVTG